MRNSTTRKIDRTRKKRFSKKHSTYSSIKEYFSDLSTAIILKDFSSEKEFENYLKCLEVFFKEHNVSYNYLNSYTTLNGFCIGLEKLIESKECPYHFYNQETSVIEKSSDDGNSINQKISSLFVGNLLLIKNKVNKHFWNECAYYFYQEYKRSIDTECFSYIIDDFFIYERIEELINSSDNEDVEKGKHQFYSLLKFNSIIEEISSVSLNKNHRNKYSKTELEIIKDLELIYDYNYFNVSNMMEVYDCEAWESFRENPDDEFNPDDYVDLACERFYSGQYVVSLEEDDFIINEYLSWVNDMENNGYWSCQVVDKIIYTPKEIITPTKKECKLAVEHFDRYHSINERLKNLVNENS